MAANAKIRNVTTMMMGGGKCSSKGKGLYYPDDDAFLDDIFDDDYVEKHFSTIPDEPACDRNRNQIMGGPQPPGPNSMEEDKKSYDGKKRHLPTSIVASFSEGRIRRSQHLNGVPKQRNSSRIG